MIWRVARAALLFVVSAIGAAEARHVALVIGNGQYSNLPALSTCGSSANVVAAALRRAGFEVTARTNLSNGQMGAAIGDFGDLVAQAPDSVEVAYVCGYAVDFHGRVFLLPAAAQLQADTDVLTQGVSAAALARAVWRPGQTGLVLLDAAGLPGHAALPLAGLAEPASVAPHGFAGVQMPNPSPAGPSELASAVVEGLSAPTVELGGFLQGLRARLPAGPRLAVAFGVPGATALLVGEPAPAAPVAGLADLASPTPDEWRRVQAALQKLGYYDGQVDGVAGAETLAAVRRFQHEKHADMTGKLTKDQTSHLLTSP